MFPLKNYIYEIPKGMDNQGAFGAPRKYDVHTGVDLYCNECDEVFATENGRIMYIIDFTGPLVGSPWWHHTKAIVIRASSSNKSILFGELIPVNLQLGQYVKEGTLLGHVAPVLRRDKGTVPSMSMLHMELYNDFTEGPVEWNLGEDKPIALEDITPYLESLKDP